MSIGRAAPSLLAGVCAGAFARARRLTWRPLLMLAAPLAAQQPLSSAPPPPSQPAVESYLFALDLSASLPHIVGTARVRFDAPLAVDTVRLDLHATMRVAGAWTGCGDDRVPAPWVHRDHVLRIAIVAAAREARCVHVAYSGAPRDGLIISADTAGRWSAFGDNFPNRARFWLPTQDHPSRKAWVSFVVTAPAGWSVVANGALVGTQDTADGRVTTTWRTERPIPTYGMVIAAGPLTKFGLGETACGFAEDGGCVPQAVWTAPEQTRWLPGAFAQAGRIVEFFAQLVGAYPYEKLGHVQSRTRYGGMENPSAIFYFDQGFRRTGGIDEGLIAHETAHQWFGNAVTEREWAHLWLSEGFATFFAALWTQHARGDSAYARELAQMREAVLKADVVTRRAVIDSVEADPNRLLNENSYSKGGLVLAMLREELGDSAFLRGIRRYVTAHRHGTAMTDDLRRAMEGASGRSLGWFFDQWLRKPGWAELRTEWAWDAATKRATLLVEQGERFGAYELLLPIEVETARGERLRASIRLDARASQAILLDHPFDAAPVAVRCAPDHRLLATCRAK
ncbi:MAG: M1 family metallopeptidase [Gemmatimonadetes bacterium]|nr:M1 family metallopeptidase [Gemmatimonadota bacterium]